MVGLGRDPEVAGATVSQTTPATARAPAADSPTVTAGAPPCAVTFPREAADPYCLRAGEADRLLAGHPWHRFAVIRSEEHTSELQSRRDLVCRLLLEKKKKK